MQNAAKSGLSQVRARELLALHGPNEIVREKSTPAWRILLSQFNSALIWLLLAACVVSLMLGERVDAIAIAAIVVLNGVIGFFQEYRAEKAVLALRELAAPSARVIRDGSSRVVPAREIVPGDLLVLEAGDIVAADARLAEAHELRTNEASLTGESQPVSKSVEPARADAPLAERNDRVFMGTPVVNGTAMAEVTATGMRTELGRIAHLISTAEESRTPLQIRLARLSRVMLVACLAIVALTAVFGLLRGRDAFEILISSISLAVAAVPEGLPAVVTVALALGVQRMSARNVLVRRLQATETLGSATVVCTDKTGTLTTGVMQLRDLWGESRERVLGAAAACCDAELGFEGRPDTGDPTEIAILRAAAGEGIERGRIERERPRVSVNPFSSERKRMSVFRSDGKLYVKGAPESVLSLCEGAREDAAEETRRMAARGLRVLAVAVGSSPEERGLRFLGLIGLADPPRSEAVDAIAIARRAGIRPVMITGDHPVTAHAIARELGLIEEGAPDEKRVHARATPEDKIRIVREWKSKGHIVAMTGDGVNDAPALREAHIGIAMGRTGTEVTKESADVILLDDNFASIIAAIHEGRGIYENIRKTIVYLLSGNSSELAVMLVAAAAGMPVPLLPIHLLWINIVTDGLPALALVLDPASPRAMERPPKRPDEPILRIREWRGIFLIVLIEAPVVLLGFHWALGLHGEAFARAFAFSTMVFSQALRSLAARSPERTHWQVGAFSNLWLLAVVFVTVVLQFGMLHVPFTREIFQLESLTTDHALLAVALGFVPVSLIESVKLARWMWLGRK